MDGPSVDDLLSWRSKVRQHTVETRSETLSERELERIKALENVLDVQLVQKETFNAIDHAIAELREKLRTMEELSSRVERVEGLAEKTALVVCGRGAA